MEQAAFEHVLMVVKALSPEDRRRLVQQLKSELARLLKPVNGEVKLVHHRERERRWFDEEQNRAQYGGQWVALEGDQVLGHGDDLRQVLDEARAKGVEVPFTGYVDPLDALPFEGC